MTTYILTFLVIVIFYIDGIFFIHQAIFEASDLKNFLIFLERSTLFISGIISILGSAYALVMLLKEIC